jgi:predicted nucleotidyltransferase
MEAMESDKLNVCLLCQTGSRAYNFATPESDDDQRGFGTQKELSRMVGLHKAADDTSSSMDGYLWDVAKFTHLALNANTNAEDVLHAESFNVLQCNVVGKLYQEHRKKFLSTHKLYNVLKGYALSEYDIATGKKKPGDMGAKRRLQVEKLGYSPKNFHHTLRLLLTGVHAFQTGEYKTFWDKDDPYWKMLMGLKMGEYNVSECTVFFNEAMEKFEKYSKTSVLPQEPDFDFVNDMLCYVVGSEVVKMFPNLQFTKE